MKKRIVCVLLTLIMLLSLVPMGASAATHSTSEAAITVLKQMTKFESDCEYFSGNEFRIGYGTVCTGKDHKVDIAAGEAAADSEVHTITEKKADEALREALKKLDEKINSFASANGLSLSQNEHDALVVFTYGAGEAWLNGTGVLKNVIVNGTETNELLNAMSLWGNINRRKVEANMYLNGVYSNTIPTGFGKVTYDADGGYMNKTNTDDGTYVYYFDRNQTIAHPVTTTQDGYKFLGWYLTIDGDVLDWVPVLTSVYHNHTLIALWQDNGDKADDVIGNVEYKLAKSQLAEKNVYDKVGGKVNSKKASNIKDSMSVDGDYIAADGSRWSHLKAGGWVKVGKASVTQQVHEQIQWTVTVTNSYVNRRVNASASSAKNGSYKQGDELYIIQEDDGWLQVGVIQDDGTVKAVGWVASIYTNWGSLEAGEGAVDSGAVVGTATVIVNGYLNIRQDAGTDHKIVGALAKNDTVDLFEIKTVNGHQWGRTKSGWICLTYTSVELKGNVAISDAGSKLYAFTGKVVDGDMIPRVAAGNTNQAQYKDHADKMQDLVIKEGKTVTLTNLMVLEGDTWAKATWTNDELAWKDAKKKDTVKTTATRSGWILVDSIAAVYGMGDGTVKLDPVKYTVAVDTINVREDAGNEFALKFSLNKGTEVEVNKIRLVGENIWGYITVQKIVESGSVSTLNGWINLASKYVTRGEIPTVEEEAHDTGKYGTVINTDSLKVRQTGATYGAKIGTLSRGTTVAVWESNSKNWYKVDSNRNGVYDYEGDGWVSGDYLEIHEGSGINSTVTDAAGNKYQTDGTGKGIVANTYSGVNVRTGPSTAHASNGKLLPGTVVEILEVSGNGKWGRTAQGWVSLDYITMVSYNESVNNNNSIPEGGIQVDSFADADRTSTTAVYTGKIVAEDGAKVYAEPDLNANVIRTAVEGANVTIHELSAVTQTLKEETVDETENTTTVITKKITTYWARINDGWVNLDTEDTCISLDALDEKVHTVTGADNLNVRKGPSTSYDSLMKLKKGDQVTVTELVLENDKVWGRIETAEKGTGYVRLDYLSEGAIYEAPKVENTTPSTPPVTPPTLGNGSNVGGFVTNTSGYRYTGKVIRANEVNVRATPSTSASKTTSLKSGQALVIYETTIAENMAWGRCDAGWIYLYYVDLTPVVNGAVDARVVYNDNTIIYTDVNGSAVAGTYSRMSTVDIYEIVGKMARTDLGWVNTDNLL